MWVIVKSKINKADFSDVSIMFKLVVPVFRITLAGFYSTVGMVYDFISFVLLVLMFFDACNHRVSKYDFKLELFHVQCLIFSFMVGILYGIWLAVLFTLILGVTFLFSDSVVTLISPQFLIRWNDFCFIPGFYFNWFFSNEDYWF